MLSEVSNKYITYIITTENYEIHYEVIIIIIIIIHEFHRDESLETKL